MLRRLKLLQIRNVPGELHRTLKSRAALAAMTLSDYALAELRRSPERLTRAEVLERVARRRPVHLPEPPAEVLRDARQERPTT